MHVAAQSLQARLWFVQGRPAEAYARVVATWPDMRPIKVGMPTLLEVRYTLLDIVLSLHEERDLSARRSGLGLAEEMVHDLLALARRIPYFEPRARLCLARLQWLRGAPSDLRQALANLREALRLAQRFGMLYDEGLAHSYLGLIAAHAGGPYSAPITPSESGPVAPPWRPQILGGKVHWPPAQSHLQQARDLLHGIASPHEQGRISSALALLSRRGRGS